MIQVKICGLTRREDAEAAAAAGASYGGVILAPGGKRSIDAERAGALFAGLPLRRVGVFVNATLEEVRAARVVAGLDVVQLHGDEDPDYLEALRGECAGALWKAIRPRSGEEFAREARRFAGVVDGLLLDGWSPAARGGTGARFPWEEVAAHRDGVPGALEFVAAGGLDPSNVGEAVRLLRPTVVDVSSGVETAPGIKDADAVSAFVAAVRAASISVTR